MRQQTDGISAAGQGSVHCSASVTIRSKLFNRQWGTSVQQQAKVQFTPASDTIRSKLFISKLFIRQWGSVAHYSASVDTEQRMPFDLLNLTETKEHHILLGG